MIWEFLFLNFGPFFHEKSCVQLNSYLPMKKSLFDVNLFFNDKMLHKFNLTKTNSTSLLSFKVVNFAEIATIGHHV